MMIMQFRAHRGHARFPENTMIAFKKAVERGFEEIETDPVTTKDGVIVLMHDQWINRTCRNADGTEIGDAARCEEDVLSYIAFPQVAEKFFAERKEREEAVVPYSIKKVED